MLWRFGGFFHQSGGFECSWPVVLLLLLLLLLPIMLLLLMLLLLLLLLLLMLLLLLLRILLMLLLPPLSPIIASCRYRIECAFACSSTCSCIGNWPRRTRSRQNR
jgi:hypothetical protein